MNNPTRLIDLPPGTLFRYGETIALKTEYYSDDGRVWAFIVGTGEFFYGGFTSPEDVNNLIVEPVEVINE